MASCSVCQLTNNPAYKFKCCNLPFCSINCHNQHICNPQAPETLHPVNRRFDELSAAEVHNLSQSEYTADNKFAGWTDVNLSAQGEQEALQAGKLIQNITIDQIHISALRRAQQTLDKIRSELTKCAPVYKTWRLNERHYGQLEGCNKIETAKLYGVEQVKKLRRDWNTKPPPVDRSDSRWPHSYEPEPTEPFSESPSDCYNRVLPYLEDKLLPLIREQKTILVIAHGTSLRCLVKFLGGLDPEAPASQEIPSGVPVIYTVDPNSLRIVETKQFLNQKELTRRQELVAKESEPANY